MTSTVLAVVLLLCRLSQLLLHDELESDSGDSGRSDFPTCCRRHVTIASTAATVSELPLSAPELADTMAFLANGRMAISSDDLAVNETPPLAPSREDVEELLASPGDEWLSTLAL